MFNFGYITKEDIKDHNPNWPEISDHPCRILVVGGFGSGKTNTLLNLIDHEVDIDEIYLYAKDPYEAKYQLSIPKRKRTGLKYLNDWKAFIEYPMIWIIFIRILKNTRQIKNEKYSLYLMIQLLICLVIKKIFIREKKLNTSLVFITQSYFSVTKNIRLNSTHYFAMKIPNKRELQ